MNTINQSFIEEHINNLVEFRNIDEIKYYLKANKIDVKDKEIENLKTSLQIMLNGTSNGQLLKIEDLANVSGGLSRNQVTGISIAIGILIGIVAIAIPVVKATAFEAEGLIAQAANQGIELTKTDIALGALKANATTGAMVGMSGFDVAQQALIGYPLQDEAKEQQELYAGKMTALTDDCNVCN